MLPLCQRSREEKVFKGSIKKGTLNYATNFWCDLADIFGNDNVNGKQELEVPSKIVVEISS